MLKARLQQYAHEIGIDLIGVTDAAPFSAATLAERAEQGYLSSFAPANLAARVDPQAWLPGAKSLIAVGLAYLTASRAPAPATATDLTGWISQYCQGFDYHRVLGEKLAQLQAWLEAEAPGCAVASFVDTGLPVERDVAVRAGLGFYGKSCMLITPGFGTWVFLGGLVTDVVLEPDEPGSGTCGSCRRCLDACPTGALVAPGVLDSSRCLSQITQNKGYIRREFRQPMGNRLFGCDDCQTVCPYNSRAVEVDQPAFSPEGTLGLAPSLEAVLTMTKGQFRRWFAPTAAGWRGKTVLQRNALVALGNSGDLRAVPLLVTALGDEQRPVMRGHAAWALGQFVNVSAEAKEALLSRLTVETDPEVRLELELALSLEAEIHGTTNH